MNYDEFIGDLHPDKNQEEPEWVKQERENFVKYRDANGDGKLDRDEVGNWILPVDYDQVGAETRHLIYEADANQVIRKL